MGYPIQHRRVFSNLFIATLTVSSFAHAQVSIQNIATTSQNAPGLPAGCRFGTFVNRAGLNTQSKASLVATVLGTGVSGANNSGIWAGATGGLALVVREGAAAPGTESGVTFSGFGDPLINASGQVAFLGYLRGTNLAYTKDSGIWAGSAGSVSLAAREGSAAPGISGGVFTGMSSLVLSGSGKVAFFAVVKGSGVTSANDVGIWAGAPGQLGLLARENNQAAGAASGTKYGSLFAPVINDSGVVAFRGILLGTGVTTSNNLAIWSGSSGNLAMVARKGNAAPGTPSGVKYFTFNDPALNNLGQLAFACTLTGSGVTSSNDQGIWAGAPGAFALVVREGLAAPGTASGVKFSYLYDPVINKIGAVAFQALLAGSGVTSANNVGIWTGKAGSLRLVARTGSSAAGLASGTKISSFVSSPTLNSRGQVSFLARLTGTGVSTANDVGIWSTTGLGTLALVAREGSLLPIAGKTILTLSLVATPSGGEDGRFACLNGAGQVIFHATFTDNTQGLFVATIS